MKVGKRFHFIILDMSAPSNRHSIPLVSIVGPILVQNQEGEIARPQMR